MTTIPLISFVIFFLLYSGPGSPAVPRKTLEISEHNAKVLEKIGDYPDLEVLSISCLENLQSLPESIGKLTRLKELRIDNGNGCSMNPVLPESIGNLRSLERLILYGAQDPDPRHPGPQSPERHKFPNSMSKLKNLVYLDLGRNGFQKIPSFLADLRQLHTLKLNFNDLSDLPDFLNTLPKLNRISLGDNCKITQNQARTKDLKRRFPKVAFDFEGEYDCRSK